MEIILSFHYPGVKLSLPGCTPSHLSLVSQLDNPDFVFFKFALLFFLPVRVVWPQRKKGVAGEVMSLLTVGSGKERGRRKIQFAWKIDIATSRPKNVGFHSVQSPKVVPSESAHLTGTLSNSK